LGIVNLIIEGLDSLPKIENPFKVFYDSWVSQDFFIK
jgi:hypothetical protein